jgi:uncharacterized membrane protein YhaH (DUF805 family)
VKLMEAWKRVVLENYAVFTGRAGLGEFWWFALASFVIYIGLFIVGGILGAIADFFLVLLSIAYFVYAIGIIIPSLAVAVRRLHDTGRSGWWYFIGLVPFVGWIILLVFLASRGNPGPNEYGPEPVQV